MGKKQQKLKGLLTPKATEQLAMLLARWLVASRDGFVWCMTTATKGLSPVRIKIITVIAMLSGSVVFGRIIVQALTGKEKAVAHLPAHLTLPPRPSPPANYNDDGLDKAISRLRQMRSQDSSGYMQFLRRHPGFEDTLIKLQQQNQ